MDNGSTWVEPNLVVTDIPYTITPSVPYSLSLASDTNSYAYIGWCYDFYGSGEGVLNFFSTNCPENVGVEEHETIPSPSINLSIFPNPMNTRGSISYALPQNHRSGSQSMTSPENWYET